MMGGSQADRGETEIRRRWPTSWLGRHARYYRDVGSTNEALLRWAADGAPHGTMCIADVQHRGRGRQGRRWHSPGGGNLYLSFLLRPPIALANSAPFSLACAVTIAETLLSLRPDLPLGLKWPNDVWIGKRKLAGVLLESRNGPQPCIVVGIGLNLRSPADGWGDLDGIATSLEEHGLRIGRDDCLIALLPGLEAAYETFVASGFVSFTARFNARSVLLNEHIVIEQGGTTTDATALYVGEDGSLLIRDERGHQRSLIAGEVHLSSGDGA